MQQQHPVVRKYCRALRRMRLGSETSLEELEAERFPSRDIESWERGDSMPFGHDVPAYGFFLGANVFETAQLFRLWDRAEPHIRRRSPPMTIEEIEASMPDIRLRDKSIALQEFERAVWKAIESHDKETRARTDVFVSYRRADVAVFAGRIADGLEYEFGEAQVFIDISKIQFPGNFVEALEDALSGCGAVIVVIGKDWLAGGRLNDSNDYVRLEIERAMTENTNVLPVLVDGAQMPSAADLPESIRGLASQQALPITHDEFKSGMRVLISALDAIL